MKSKKTRRTKSWPKNEGEMGQYDDIVNPIRAAFEAFFPDTDWEKATKRKGYTWKGLPFGEGVNHIVPPPGHILSADGLKQMLDNDQDVLDALIQIAFSLGFEQGRRYSVNQTGHFRLLLDRLEARNSKIEKLSKTYKRKCSPAI